MRFVVQTGEEEIELKALSLYEARVEFGLKDKKGEVQLRLDDGKYLRGEYLEQFCRENKIYYF